MIRRTVHITLVSAVLAVVVIGVLQSVEAGRILTVEQIVRFERRWDAYFPIQSARGLIRGSEPWLASVGLLRPVRVEVEPGVSLLLDPGDWIGRNILLSPRHLWEPDVWAAIEVGLAPDAVFLDVGAHIGYDALKAARRVGPAGRVIAFEPNPRTAAQLRANLQASGATNMSVQEIACTDQETTLTFYDSSGGGNSGTSSLAEGNAGQVRTAFTVRGRPIDAVVAELGLERVDVIKVDVEGAELMVLRGAAHTLQRFQPSLVLEVVSEHLAGLGTSVEQLQDFLASLGYVDFQQIDATNRRYRATSTRAASAGAVRDPHQ